MSTTRGRGVTIYYPITFGQVFSVLAVMRTENTSGASGSQSCQYVSYPTNDKFNTGSYDTGNGYAGCFWFAIGRA